jgi:rubredoxin
MNKSITIKINFTGGIISPGDLMEILTAAASAGVGAVSFGLRQQLFIEVERDVFTALATELKSKNIAFETGTDTHPNIVSSYPAEEIFITNTWLSEGVYKDIFDAVDYIPKLKINISDSRQSFTPLFTGNINWVASDSQHFWYLFIRFPKTNCIYEWPDLVYTNDVAAITKHIEATIFSNCKIFFDTPSPEGALLYKIVMQQQNYNVKKVEKPVVLPAFMLPYYEGFNRINSRYWLGIYRRDEKFAVKFLQEFCTLCLATKIGQLCATPWKSIIIKGIEEKDRHLWDAVLGRHQINVRHAANELNFQVEDDCKEGLGLKTFLIKHLQRDDTRTFGICIGIKTRTKSEVFSSILIKRKPLFTLAGIGFFNRYDILCAKDFNPNERTGFTFSTNNFKWLLPEQLRRAIIAFYGDKENKQEAVVTKITTKEIKPAEAKPVWVHQCPDCFTVYDAVVGELDNNIAAGTAFENLPASYRCQLCETPKQDFKKINQLSLVFTAV